jgi:MATE family multidrug resistance protein
MSPFSYRRLLSLAWPLILGSSANSAMMFTDRLFISRLGTDALAASLPASLTAVFCACFFQAASQYVATFAGQHEGAGESRECGPWVWQGLLIALVAGMVNAAAIPALPWILGLMHAAPAVHEAMVSLDSWLFGNACAVCIIAAIGGYFAGTGRPRLVLVLNGSLLALNAWLNWCLIFGHCRLPRLGLVGSAIGTVTATWTIAGLAVILLLRRTERTERATWPATLSLRRFILFCRFALPQGARQVVEIAAWQFFVFAVGSFGTIPLAASNIVLNWNLLTFMIMIGLSQAITVAVGQAVGARDLAAARATARRGVALELGYGLAIGAAYFALMDPMIAAFLGDVPAADREHLVALSRRLFVIAALWNVGDALNMAFSGALAGAGDTRWPFVAIALGSLLLMVAPLVMLLALPAARWTAWGVEPVLAAWIATLAYVTLVGIALALRYRSGTWERMSVR